MYKHVIYIGLAGNIMALAMPAQAQMRSDPWGFQTQNRASIAALIRQVEGGPQPVATTSITSLVCAGDGGSSASGNSTCVILNNAMGDLRVGQEANGNQTASSETEQVTQTSAESVLETLQGTAQNATP